MRRHTEHCDFCDKLLKDSNGVQVATKHGFTGTLGYSIGGWGSRQNFLKVESVEICDECFQPVKKASEKLANIIEQQKTRRLTDGK